MSRSKSWVRMKSAGGGEIYIYGETGMGGITANVPPDQNRHSEAEPPKVRNAAVSRPSVHESTVSKVTMTGTWSDGAGQPRASLRTTAFFSALTSPGVTQTWSRRRPLSATDQSAVR